MPRWTDKPIVAGRTHIQAVHLAELRMAVSNARVAAGLSRVHWTDPVISRTVPIRAVHYTELRAAIQELWTHAGMGSLPTWTVGSAPSTARTIRASDVNDLRAWFDAVDPPSLIGASWTNNSRNWNTKSGWDVQLVYTNPTDPNNPNRYQVVGENVRSSHLAERNVIVRVDYREGQNLPPNEASLASYLSTLATICQDSRFRDHAWGYIIGNEPNLAAENGQVAPMMPSWYARVFCGYGTDSNRTDNALQVVRANQPAARVLVAAVAPYSPEHTTPPSPPYALDAEWLNYFNEMCQDIGQAMANRGLGAVDGFALHVYGRVGSNGTINNGANEPHKDVQAPKPQYPDGVWYGFTAYKNWRDVVDSDVSGAIAGAALWITETNTRTDAPSKESYPSGWYLEALKEIHDSNANWERIMSVCWFVDRNYDTFWPDEALTNPQGKCELANDDFSDALLNTPY